VSADSRITDYLSADYPPDRRYPYRHRRTRHPPAAGRRLCLHRLPAGDYVYTGSARRNLEARIARHCRRDKKLHWHIDYLLAAAETRIIDIQRLAQPECFINQQQAGRTLIPGFGASDCRGGCGSHLKHLGNMTVHD
jgi:Uri superfamily endonuclease